MSKISVVTPTVRRKGLDLVKKALDRQTFDDFEWVVISPEDWGYGKWVKDPGKNEGDYWSIYKAYNEGLRHSTGELVVSWQDYTFADPTVLERLWEHHKREPKTLVTPVGNKYEDDTWQVMTWKDPRERADMGTFYQCYHNDIEWNLCACPKEAFFAVGGFDEYLDRYSSLCGLDILDRLNILGDYDFKIDQSIKTYSLEHGRLPGWDKHLPFDGPYEARRKFYRDNPVLDYLR